MPPIQEYRYSNWDTRGSDELEEIEPLRKYVFVCEGSRTEVFYFRALIDRRNELGLHPLVDLSLWEKTDEDEGLSNPQALLRFARREKESNKTLFDPSHDRMVVVFDLDIYSRVGAGREDVERRRADFEAIRKDADTGFILAVTNPSFELFLLLHAKGAYERLVLPHEREILENRKDGGQRYVQRLFTESYGMNPKRNRRVGSLAGRVETAIEEERFLNHDLDNALTELTCNVGSIIETIRNDRPQNDRALPRRTL
jgi:hypothetical protein